MLTPTTSPETFANLNLVGTVQSVTIASPPVVTFRLTTTEGVPVIGFGTTAKSATAAYASYPNLAFSLAKLVPSSGGTPSKWVNYIVTGVPTTVGGTPSLGRPSTDNTGTLVDNGDGTYVYTFMRDVPGTKALVDSITPAAGSNKADLGDLTYDPNLTHRLTIQIAGNAPGTGTNTPNAVQVTPGVPLKKAVDVIYDFVPATGQAPAANANRKMVANANCESCHSTLGGIPGDASGGQSGLQFHGGSRNNIEYCVICHTEQRKFGRTEAAYDAATLTFTGNTNVVDGRAVGNAPNFLHKIHLGSHLAKNGYNYADVKFDLGGYSQDIRNCEKCHDPANAATPQAVQWKEVPNRVACGSCHDGINFDTGVGVSLADAAKGLTQSTDFRGKAHPENALDGTCTNAGCHGPVGGVNQIDLYHRPVTPPNDQSALHVDGGSANTNAAWLASNQNRLPEGAIKIEYEIDSVSLNATRNPVMKFRLKQNGTVTPLLDYASAPLHAVTQEKEIWANFMGAPSVYFVWAVPQDGIAKPADFNASSSGYLRTLWNPTNTVGTLAGPDASGWYTATLTSVTVVPEAVMFTGGVGYSYNVRNTLPLTQTNLADYPATKSTVAGLPAGMPNAVGGLVVIAKNVQKVGTGFTGRRAIVEDARCNSCHQEVGAFTEEAFHGGQRNDGTTCAWCHTPNRNSSGWTADSKQIMHGIHAAAKRTVPYTWHSISTTDNFSKIKYPGVLARCEQCHIPGSYDFRLPASADAAGLGSDGLNKRQFVYISGTPSATDISLSPYVVGDNPYGSGFSHNAGTGVTTLPADTTLIQSPTVSACVGCHDSTLAISHMEVNGGRFYDVRTTQFAAGTNNPAPTATTEQCMVCHSAGKLADTNVVHAR